MTQERDVTTMLAAHYSVKNVMLVSATCPSCCCFFTLLVLDDFFATRIPIMLGVKIQKSENSKPLFCIFVHFGKFSPRKAVPVCNITTNIETTGAFHTSCRMSAF